MTISVGLTFAASAAKAIVSIQTPVAADSAYAR